MGLIAVKVFCSHCVSVSFVWHLLTPSTCLLSEMLVLVGNLPTLFSSSPSARSAELGCSQKRRRMCDRWSGTLCQLQP